MNKSETIAIEVRGRNRLLEEKASLADKLRQETRIINIISQTFLFRIIISNITESTSVSILYFKIFNKAYISKS